MMSEDFKGIVIDLFKSLDRLDALSIIEKFSDDVEQVDELTQKWSRGKAVCAAAISGIMKEVSDLKSDISDLNVISSSDMAIVTCTMKQSYTYEGKSISIVAPTTVAFRRESAGWKIVLLQSVPFA
jgi:ketosteroid isomerase-like protein